MGASDRPSRDPIPVRSSDGKRMGWLSMIVHRDLGDRQLISDLTDWRNANRNRFLTQFEARDERTEGWLRDDVIPDASRAMFVVSTVDHLRVGHLGVRDLSGECPELDNMIRGRSGGDPKLMYWAEIALIEFAFEISRSDLICLHVFSNNWIPISIHQSIGFEIDTLSRLSRIVVGDDVKFLIDSDEGEAQRVGYQRMVLERSVFIEQFPERNLEKRV